jgi:hypothetical protein
MSPGSGVFSVLPENFFSPLAWVNKQHYAALLVLYYRLFQENTRGLERELVIREFMAYLVLHRDALADEGEGDAEGDIETGAVQAGQRIVEEKQGSGELDFGDDAMPASREGENSGAAGKSAPGGSRLFDEREAANRFLRRLIAAGWLGEETLADFTRVINITPWGKPFFESLVKVDEGLKIEYESHVVNVYSSLCGETVKENGHFMVLKAREEARALIDSLKVLSQSIKGYYDALNAEEVRSRASEVLHEHYDLYAGEVLDKAYKRLKTSDNVSRYRQSIFRQVAALLGDDAWLNESAGKYLRILQTTREDCRKRLVSMLEDIRDDLRSVDPMEDDIDKRNADYSRQSIEIIKAHIEPDSTVAGKLGILTKAVYNGNEELQRQLAHGVYRISFLSPSSLVFRTQREEGNFQIQVSKADLEALSKTEEEFFTRMRRRLSIKRINAWLDEQGGRNRQILFPADLINDEDSFIRFVYALLYGDSRKDFTYTVEDEFPGEAGVSVRNTKSVSAAGYAVPDIRFRKKEGGKA